MNSPYVSNWFLYFLTIVDGVNFLIGMVFLLSLLLLIAMLITRAVFAEDNEWKRAEESFKNKWLRTVKISSWVLGIATLLVVMFPSKETFILMEVNKHITPQNVSEAWKVGKDLKNEVKNDIIDLLNAVKGKDSKDNKDSKDSTNKK